VNVSGWNRKKREDRRAEKQTVALVMLDVDLKKLEREPKFTEMLEHQSLGGLAQVIAAMRLSSDPILQRFLEYWDTVDPEFQEVLPWEAVAQKTEIDSRQLLGSIIIALRQHSAMEVKIAALTAHPDITKATVESALLPGNDGFRDRHLIHTALGFLAPPKGQTINFNMLGAQGSNEAEDVIDAEDIDMNEMFPDLTVTQRKMLPE
jgi:hypothetical protein